jgi:thiosulfate/3-mercaptopyruvate sulfurtransferase
MAGEFGPLVEVEWLREHLGDADVRVVDLRWYLDGRSGSEAFEAGHLPGAVFIDLDRDLTAPQGDGRHPLPSRQQFQETMRSAGIGNDSLIVVYDDQGGFTAARLWWLLRYFGHAAAAVLDGGIQAWGGQLETGPAPAARGDFVAAAPDRSREVGRAEVRAGAAGTLIDARAGERYRGEIEPIDPKAGHIPGASNLAWRELLGPDWRFLPAEELRRLFTAAGAGTGRVTMYCGSGVSSCVNVLAFELAGLGEARLYAGSWSDWSNQDLPVATGPEP